VAQLTTTEAAVLALLAIEGERSGYDLGKLVQRAIGHVWSPARSALYAVLPRLVEHGLATRKTVAQSTRPDKQLYRVNRAGRAPHEGARRMKALVAAVLVFGAGAVPAHATSYVGTYRLPETAEPVAFTVDIAGSRATVALGAGHAGPQVVPLRAGRFTVPGNV